MSYLLGKRGVVFKLLVALLAVTAVASACGSDSSSDDAAPAATTAAPAEETATTEATSETTEAPATTATPTTTTEAPPVGPSQGGSASLAIEAEATGLRPWEDTCSSPCYNMMQSVFDPLVSQYADGSYGPNIAKSWVSNDDYTVWTVQLQEGIAFTDGTLVTAQTIVDMFVVQQTGAASAGVIASSNLIGVEATGEHEVTYTLSDTNGPFMSVLSNPSLGFVFNAALVPAGDDDAMAAAANAPTGIGTGPFMVTNRDVDNKTEMERNPNYWMSDSFGTQLPYLDSVSFHPIPDEGTRLDSLASGTVTAMQTLRQSTIRDARIVAEDGSFWMFEFQGNNAGGGMFNVLVAPYDDVRVRRGLVMATRQESIIAALGGEGISEPATQLFAKDSPWYSEEAAEAYASYDFDGERNSFIGSYSVPSLEAGALELGLRADYKVYEKNGLRITPTLGLRHLSGTVEGFSEAGWAGALSVQDQKQVMALVDVGLSGSYRRPESRFEMQAELRWQKNFEEVERDIRASFTSSGSPLQVAAPGINTDAFVYSVGFFYDITGRSRLGLTYRGENRSETDPLESLNLRLRITF